MSYRIVYSPRSRRDLERIQEYITRESGDMETVKRFLRGLLDACESLSLLPERFPPYTYGRVWRMMPHGNYLIFFQVLAGDVRVGHIRHAARKPFRG